MAARRKQHSRDKRRKATWANFVFEAWDSAKDPTTGKIEVTSYLHMPWGRYELRPEDRDIELAMLNQRFHWLVTIKVKLQAPNQELYFETVEFLVDNCLLNDLEGFYYQQKEDLIRPLSKSHIVDTGFTARTLSQEARRRYLSRADESNPLQNDKRFML